MGNRSSNERQKSCPSETELADFQLTGYIGVGTFGEVFSVLHKGMHMEYALKAICKRRLAKQHLASGVLRELDLLQALNHPFIVNLWFSFQDDNCIYMICDLLTGGNLAFHLRQHGRFSESRAKLLICELALALDYLHRQRIGHFDVKPANILLAAEGHAHLADFSLSRRLEPGQLVTSFSGTRYYMAPEILLTALGEKSGFSLCADWWALGTTFYELLRGRLPHECPASFSSLQMLNIICMRSVVMPSRWPSDLISFLRAMINPDPSRRINSFAEFCLHSYMSRIEWKDVFERKMVPIFTPARNCQRLATNNRRHRATISVPIGAHKSFGFKGRNHFRRHLHPKDQTPELAKGQLVDDEIRLLNANFKSYNRFRCEIRPAEPRLSLDLMDKKAHKTMDCSPNDNSKLRKRMNRAEMMRMQFQTNNREVNYSM